MKEVWTYLLTYSGAIQGVFVGHDHCNDFFVDFEGMLLAYGRKTGVGGYGPSPS